jgi:hypothetical protein
LPPEELASRHQLAIRYETGKKLDEIEVQIRGIRAAIDILAAKGRELQEEKKQLLPKMKETI